MRVGALLSLMLLFHTVAHAAPDTAKRSEWWIVLGSVPSPDNTFNDEIELAVRRIADEGRACGLEPFWDFSSKFRNFRAGYSAVVAGPYATQMLAQEILAKAKRCSTSAYVKQGSYAGE